jgi:hypothetical protein
MTVYEFEISELPEPAQEYIRSLRSEAAEHRVQKNEWRQKYTDAGETLAEANKRIAEAEKFKEDHEKFLAEHEILKDWTQRLEIASDFGLPSSDAKRLQGSTPEELKADAEAFAQRVNKPGGPKKDLAAGDPPTEPKSDPIRAAFDKALGDAE